MTGEPTAARRVSFREAAMALPNIIKLLGRLIKDRRIDRRRRLVAMGAVAYAALPFDLVPDRIPVIGKADDVVVALLAVRMLLDGAPDGIVEEHWDGPPQILEIFDDMVGWITDLMPARLRWAFGRLADR